MLEQAIEAEVEAFLASRKDLKLADGSGLCAETACDPHRLGAVAELWRNLGDDEVRKATYRGG